MSKRLRFIYQFLEASGKCKKDNLLITKNNIYKMVIFIYSLIFYKKKTSMDL